MKTLVSGLLLMSFSIAAISTKAQTADQIITKYIAAIGGKDVVTKINTIYTEGTLEVMGNEAPSITYLVNNKGFKNQVDFNGQQIVQVVTDKGGWMINPMAGQTTATALPEDQLKPGRLHLDIAGPLVDYAAKGNKVKLVGTDTTGGAIVYNILLTTKDSVDVNYFIDGKTGNMVKTTSKIPGQDAEIVTTFSDFRKTDIGYIMPYSQQVVLPQVTINLTTKKVEFNKPVDPTIFDMPK